MPRQPQLDPRLEQLYGLNQLTQQQQQNDTANTAALVKMLGDLYGLSLAPQEAADRSALAQSHARYYDTETEGQLAERGANAKARNAMALKAMFEAGLPPETIAAQAREFGFVVPEPKKPQDEFTGPAGNPDLVIPEEYRNDPEFKALGQQAATRQTVVTQQQKQAARAQALARLRKALGIPEEENNPFNKAGRGAWQIGLH